MRDALAVLLLAAGGLLAQPKPAELSNSGLVLRFETNLVQLDAVVTGRDGRRVTELKPDDFEILQDGKPQKITHFSCRKDETRTIAILVDDILMEFADYALVRDALARFIDQEMRPGDKLSLVYTSHGSGALRQFTSDRQLLHRAVDRMYWRPPASVDTAFPGMALIRELQQAIAELGQLPGRKSLVLVAPGARTQLTDVRGVADLANRTSVSVYTMGAKARTQPDGGQDTLGLLAAATGGTALRQLDEALDDSAGYYLVGWDPGGNAFRTGAKSSLDYHRVQIRMRDKNLRARTRDGYFAREGSAGSLQVSSAREQMRQALVSPFGSDDLDVTLTSLFQRQEAMGSYVDSLLHIAAKGVRFHEAEGGCWNARLEMARAIWPVDPGIPQNDRVTTQMLDVHACGETATRVRRDGFLAVAEDRVPTPGSYQVRVAVRNADSADGMIPLGSASQFLVIPDLHRGVLTLSGLTLWSGDAPAAPESDVSYRPANRGDPAVRQFRTGEEMRYAFRLFGDAAGAPDMRLRVLRNGQEVLTAPVTATAPGEPVTGVLPLTGIPQGDYVLGVVASSATGKAKAQRAEQWVDFVVR